MRGITIYHNGECSKSKGALEILQEQDIPHTVRWYLTDALSREELRALLAQLQINAAELVRKNEPVYLERYAGKNLAEEDWIEALLDNPVLMERPVVSDGTKAIIARPPEKVLEFIK